MHLIQETSLQVINPSKCCCFCNQQTQNKNNIFIMSLILPQLLISFSKKKKHQLGINTNLPKALLAIARTNEKQQYNKQLTSIAFSTTDRFSFICIKPRSTWLWTSSDKQWAVKSNRTLFTGHASFRCVKSSATWHRGITLYSAPREDIIPTTLINKINFSGILEMSVRSPYTSHEPLKGSRWNHTIHMSHIWCACCNLEC